MLGTLGRGACGGGYLLCIRIIADCVIIYCRCISFEERLQSEFNLFLGIPWDPGGGSATVLQLATMAVTETDYGTHCITDCVGK